MRYPTVKDPGCRRDTINTFGGYDHNHRIAEGSFYDMENMTCDHYPVLSPRGGRTLHAQGVDMGGILGKDCMCWVDNGQFVMNGYPVDMGLTPGEKQLVSMGAYVIIFPDKKFINTLDLTDFGDLEAEYVSKNDVTFALSDQSGAVYSGYTVSQEPPDEPENGDYWLSDQGLKCYSAASALWVDIAATYVKISCPGIGRDFSQYDGVRISGILPDALQDLNGDLVLWDRGEDWLLVAGLIENYVTQPMGDGAVTVQRRLPQMDFVIESGNRLWGCRYGTNKDGQVVNEIYSSKLADFKNWSCYMGLSTDSYSASVGSDGPFTGAICHLGYPLFFKENCLHKVYGSYPAAYQIQTTACRGVQAGCGKSLAIVEDTLCYKSRGGVCAYDGSLPSDISRQLGGVQYHSAVAGAWGSKYYICMKDDKGAAHLFVYDLARGLWCREDDIAVTAFAQCPDGLYALSGNEVWDLCRGDGQLRWWVQTGKLGLLEPEHKYICRLTARLSLAPGSRISIWARYDGKDRWEQLATVTGKGQGCMSVPVRTRRCGFMELRLQGDGPAKLYSLTKTYSEGSDAP